MRLTMAWIGTGHEPPTFLTPWTRELEDVETETEEEVMKEEIRFESDMWTKALRAQMFLRESIRNAEQLVRATLLERYKEPSDKRLNPPWVGMRGPSIEKLLSWSAR